MLKDKKKTLIALVLILALGLALRLLMVYASWDNFSLAQNDARNYQNMSHQLVEKGIYGYCIDTENQSGSPNAYVTPGYPIFLSIVYFFFRNPMLQITIVRLLQAFIGTLTILLGFLIAKKLSRKNTVALLCALFIAVNPTYVQSVSVLLTEVLSLFTLLLYIYCIITAIEKESKWLYLLSGGLFALNVLVRPASLPLILVPFIYLFFSKYKFNFFKVFKIGVLHLVGFAIIMSPWVIRNFITLNSFILTSTLSGNPLLAGTYPYMNNLFADTQGTDIMATSDSQQAYAIERIIKGFSTEPLLYIKWFTVGKISYLFKEPWLMSDRLHYLVQVIPHITVLLGGLLGIVLKSLKNKKYLFFNIYFILMFVLLLPFIPVPRYTYQVMFFFIFGLAYLIGDFKIFKEESCQKS